MRLYRTSYLHTGSFVTRCEWQGTQAEARTVRKALTEDGHKAVQTDEVEVPTVKPHLIAWLNANATGE